MHNTSSDPAPDVSTLSPARKALLELLLAEQGLAEKTQTARIPRRKPGTPQVLSYGQQRMWYLQQLDPQAPTFNISLALRLDGDLDPGVLEKCIDLIIARHDILRTSFSVKDGLVTQVVAPELAFSLPVADLRHQKEGLRSAELQRLLTAERLRPFDLNQDHLLRTKLFMLEKREFVFSMVIHHIISDHTSVRLFFQELAQHYRAFMYDEPVKVPELPIQYADYCIWQQDWLQSPDVKNQLTYWREKLGGDRPAAELPTDFARPAVQNFHSASESLNLEPELVARLTDLTRSEKASLFMVLLSAFKVLICRYLDHTDVAVGSPIAMRNRSEVENLLGLFLNTLVLRTDLSGSPTFLEVLHRVRQTALEAFANQDIPFEKLLEELHPARDLSRTPFFQVFFNMLNTGDEVAPFPGIEARFITSPTVGSKFDFTLYVTEMKDTIGLKAVYNAHLFTPERIIEMLAQLRVVLKQAVEQPDIRIDEFSLVTRQARSVLPDPAMPFSNARPAPTIIERFAEHLRLTPESVAVTGTQSALTYLEVEQQSNHLAGVLVQHGLGKGEVVAIYAAHSPMLLPALLGILKAGGVFSILDPAYPVKRLLSCLDAAKPRYWMELEDAGDVPPELNDGLQNRSITRISKVAQGNDRSDAFVSETVVSGNDLAYVAFTSGTTGVPKAVMGEHRSLSHFLEWHTTTFGFDASDRFSMLSGLSHDPLLRDLFTPIWLGATLCIPDRGAVGSPGRLLEWLAETGISVMHLTPPVGHLLAESTGVSKARPLTSLKFAFFGGDRLSQELIERINKVAPNATFVNFYGTTETPQGMGFQVIQRDMIDVTEGALSKEMIPLGRGIDGAQLLVITTGGQLAGIGEVGEIYIRSPYLARGYYRDEQMTQERFARNPFSSDPADRVYRTGDQGRFLPDGRVEFGGRKDGQVKIRGFRVELQEIAALLKQHSEVQESVVTVLHERSSALTGPKSVPAASKGSGKLTAYFTTRESTVPAADALRSFLRERLPEYMVPSSYIKLDAMPLTVNGKIDTSALPLEEPTVFEGGFEAPDTPTEKVISDIWQEVLEVDRVGVLDNFFDLGGHSLLSIQVIEKVEQRLGVRLNPREFIYQTLRQMAASCDERQSMNPGAANAGFVKRVLGSMRKLTGWRSGAARPSR